MQGYHQWEEEEEEDRCSTDGRDGYPPFSWLYRTLAPTFLSPGDRAARVESVRGWRALGRAERDAGMPRTMNQVLIPFFRCSLCGICIGPGYYETELYLYPVYHERVCLRDDAMHEFHDGAWLFCCGGCARSPRRMLPEFLKLVDAHLWETTCLIVEDAWDIERTNMRSPTAVMQIRAALSEYVLSRCRYLLFLLALSMRLPTCLLVHFSVVSPSRDVGATENDAPLCPLPPHQATNTSDEHTSDACPQESSSPEARPLPVITQIITALDARGAKHAPGVVKGPSHHLHRAVVSGSRTPARPPHRAAS